jgi:putative two-component system hydrogenase maturation factor HypX/HoxX
MRILFLTHSFNSLTQRLFVELTRCGHEVSIELDINDTVSEEAVALFAPDLVIAPFLKRAIPASIWEQRVCLVVHPGIVGDRGPSSLDWAIADRVRTWGVTVLQANAVMDGGDVWAHVEFPMRFARKSSLYRNEVSDAAAEAVLLAVERFAGGTFRASRVDPTDRRVRGRERPPMTRDDRRIDWARDDTETVLSRIHAADGYPGVVDTVAGLEVHLYNAVAEDRLRGEPGSIVATRDDAVCRATVDGAVWVTHLKRANHGREALKLPATHVLAERLAGVPHDPLPLPVEPGRRTLHEIRYREHGPVGYLHFDFYNGAMSTARCERLRDAYLHACGRDVRVIVLMGGHDFWSNGIDLNLIESAASPADESWRNINAMDDLCKEIVLTDDRWTTCARRSCSPTTGSRLRRCRETPAPEGCSSHSPPTRSWHAAA